MARARYRRTRRRHHGSGGVRERLPGGAAGGLRAARGTRARRGRTRPSPVRRRDARTRAATRRLAAAVDTEVPAASSLLAHLEPIVAATPREGAAATRAEIEPKALVPMLRRLVAPAAPRPTGSPRTIALAARPEFVWAGQAAVHVGTVVHRYLQRIAEQGLALWSAQRLVDTQASFARELELLGVEPARAAERHRKGNRGAVPRARRPARPVGAGTARGSARGAPADATHRSRARACPPRPHFRRGWPALDRGFQDEPARRRELERISRLRS